jgi:hypothetical protein
MRSRLRLYLFCLALLIAEFAAAQAQNAQIPATHGTTFAGNQVTLPADLHGRVGVLVIGFSKNSGDRCKGWGQRVAGSYGDSRDVSYYQMPVLEGVPKLIRGMVVKGIRSGVAGAEEPHFLPTFSGEAEWRKVAHYANADDAYVLVVDGEGKVRWQTSGKVTDAGFETLKEQVETLRKQSAGTVAK